MNKSITLIGFCLIIFCPNLAYTCDYCSNHRSAKLNNESRNSAITLHEQFTKFNFIGTKDEEHSEDTKAFNSTVLSAVHDITKDLGFQLNIPFNTRNYRIKDHERFYSENDSGVGDISLGINYSPFNLRTKKLLASMTVYAGLKLPTGETGSISSEDNNSDHEHSDFDEHKFASHGAPIASATGGRILSIGTGSVDYLLGASFAFKSENLLWLNSLQYTLRTEGDFDYQFANDFVWSTGPGMFIYEKERSRLAIRVVLSGEHKGNDRKANVEIIDSSASNIYLGPEVTATLNNNWSTMFACDVPTYRDRTETTLIPDWRLKASLAYYF